MAFQVVAPADLLSAMKTCGVVSTRCSSSKASTSLLDDRMRSSTAYPAAFSICLARTPNGQVWSGRTIR